MTTFDTTGTFHRPTGSAVRGNPADTVITWAALSPFTQGYIEAMLRPQPETISGIVRFSDLAPETLARIIADCEAMRSGLQINHGPAGGREAWEARQGGWVDWGTTPRKDWPPLTVQLGDDGKVRFSERG